MEQCSSIKGDLFLSHSNLSEKLTGNQTNQRAEVVVSQAFQVTNTPMQLAQYSSSTFIHEFPLIKTFLFV